MPRVKKIGVLTGGEDAPGLNAVIRAVVKPAHDAESKCRPRRRLDGLLDPSRHASWRPDVTGILQLGGTILGTTNHGDPFEYPVDTLQGKVEHSDKVVETFSRWSCTRSSSSAATARSASRTSST